MTKIKSHRDTLTVHIPFLRPVMDWQNRPTRFMEMVYDVLHKRVTINPSDFSVKASGNLSEVLARFSIFGGASHITLSADKLAFEFLNMLPGEFPTAMEILRLVHDAFVASMSECRFDTINIQSYEHVEIGGGTNVADYLSRYRQEGVARAFSSFDFVEEPGTRFHAIARDGSWQCSCQIERSGQIANGLFMNIGFILRHQYANQPYDAKIELIRKLAGACLTSLDLEWQKDGT